MDFGRLTFLYPDYERVAHHSPSIGLREEQHRPVATLQLVLMSITLSPIAVVFAITTAVTFAARFALSMRVPQSTLRSKTEPLPAHVLSVLDEGITKKIQDSMATV